MSRSLVRGVPGIIVMVEAGDSVPGRIEEVYSKMDDAYWTAELRRPFSWQGFINWWVARRYLLPRDVRLSWR